LKLGTQAVRIYLSDSRLLDCFERFEFCIFIFVFLGGCVLGFEVQILGFGLRGVGFGVWDLGCRVWGHQSRLIEEQLDVSIHLQSIWAHELNGAGLFPTPKLTDLYRKPSMST
jgi:hypothetical protein